MLARYKKSLGKSVAVVAKWSGNSLILNSLRSIFEKISHRDCTTETIVAESKTSETSNPINIPGPPFEVKLSAFDARYDGFFSRRILVFRSSASIEEVTNVFQKALHYLVQKVPVLGGEVSDTDVSPTGQIGWKKIVKGPGILLHVKDLRDKIDYAELKANNFAPSLLKDEELIPVPLTFKPKPFNATDFQLNFIDGGILLSCCFAHIIGDGNAMTEILRLLAGYCKAVQECSESSLNVPSTSPQLGLDRKPMLGLKSSQPWSMADHPAISLKKPGDGMTLKKNLPDLVFKIYRIGHENLIKLKRDATDKRVSSNDALVSAIWRAVLVNRIANGIVKRADGDPVELGFPVGAYHILGLGSGYIGNTLVNRGVLHINQQEILQEDPLKTLAAAIRAEVNSVTPDMVASYCQMSESGASVTDMMPTLIKKMGSTSVLMASLFHSESILESDWGKTFGNHAVRLRCSDRGLVGALRAAHFVLPRMPDGSCEILLCLYEDGIAAVEKDDVFSKYFEGN